MIPPIKSTDFLKITMSAKKAATFKALPAGARERGRIATPKIKDRCCIACFAQLIFDISLQKKNLKTICSN